MKCEKCNNFIPQSVGNCPYCKTFYGLSKESHPMVDKYGLPTKIVPIDTEKNEIREKYIEQMEFKKNKYKQETIYVSNNYDAKELINIFPTLVFGLFLLSAIISTIFPMQYRVAILALFFTVSTISIWIILQKIKNKQEAQIKIKYSNVARDTHKKFDKRSAYYESEKIIGFSIFDHMKYENEILVKYYTFYEIDRDNIKKITYDSETACYVIHTLKPVYQNYSQPPTYTLYLADVFDDTILTNALKHNLPPKQINF